MADCTVIGGSTVCDGDVSHAEVGRRIIFPRGPAGERVGGYVVRPPGSLPQALPRDAPPPDPRALTPPGGPGDPRRGEDFGAFEFRSPPPAGLPRTGPLR